MTVALDALLRAIQGGQAVGVRWELCLLYSPSRRLFIMLSNIVGTICISAVHVKCKMCKLTAYDKRRRGRAGLLRPHNRTAVLCPVLSSSALLHILLYMIVCIIKPSNLLCVSSTPLLYLNNSTRENVTVWSFVYKLKLYAYKYSITSLHYK